jgi:hypothetical protein
MDGLVDDGFVILGGPVDDGEQTLHVVEAADERNRGTPCRGSLGFGWTAGDRHEPWALWLDSRPKDSAR